MKLSEDIHPLSELKSSAGALVDAAESSGRPQVITRYGRAAAVLLSVRAFEALEGKGRQADLVAAVAIGERDVEAGRLVDHESVVDRLRRWAMSDES